MSEGGRVTAAASLLSIPPCMLDKVLRLCTYEEMSHIRAVFSLFLKNLFNLIYLDKQSDEALF
jgi:hypothetical protein